jgi:hypothetical protein
MAVSVGGAIDWAQEHPVASIAIGAGGLIFILWLLGAFSRKDSGNGADAATQSMTAAYYAAEAQQAVVGGQIQIANVQATPDTAIAGLTTDAAVKINKAQTKAAVTIGQQNADTTTKLGEQALNATYSNNASNVAIAKSNNESFLAGLIDTNRAGLITSFFDKVLPLELQTYGASGIVNSIPGIGQLQFGGALSPAQMRSAGYSDQAISAAGGWNWAH